MKKIKSIVSFFCVALIMVCTFSLVACSNNNEGVKYNLVSVTGLDGVSTKSYEYSYVILYEDGTYYLENKTKQNDIITKQSGKYLRKDGSLVLSESDNGNDWFLYQGETIVCSDKTLKVTAEIYGEEVTMTFEV